MDKKSNWFLTIDTSVLIELHVECASFLLKRSKGTFRIIPLLSHCRPTKRSGGYSQGFIFTCRVNKLLIWISEFRWLIGNQKLVYFALKHSHRKEFDISSWNTYNVLFLLTVKGSGSFFPHWKKWFSAFSRRRFIRKT